MLLKDYLSELEQYFEIIKIIGYGGMGLCYLGRNIQTKKLYALKVLHPDWQTHAVAQQQFAQEAELEQKFQYQTHIVHTQELLNLKNLQVKVMHYMQGMTLKQYLASSSNITATFAEKVFTSIAKALKLIHAQGISHGDIKPSNIFIETKGSIKLFDFGIAKRSQAKADQLLDQHHLRALTRMLFKAAQTNAKPMLNRAQAQ